MKKHLFVIFMILPFIAHSQDTYTMKFLPQLPESQWLNASNQPEAKVSIGIPVISAFSFYIYNSGFTYHDVFHTVNDTMKSINMGALFSQLKPVNYVSFGTSIPIFSVNVAKRNVSIGFSVNERADFQFSYPANMFKLLWFGNGQYLGKDLQVGNFGINLSWYREFALHAAVTHNKWTFGISPKILVGKANINTVQSSLILNTDPNLYTVRATAKMNVQMSGIADSTDNANGGYFNSTENAINYIMNVQNIGHAVDLGARYTVNENLNISGGINNLGYIHWNSYIHNYTIDQRTFVFDGLHLENFLQGDTNAVTSQTLKDSITHLLKFDKNTNHYTTYLPYDFFILGNYQLNHHWFGLELTVRRFNSEFLYAGTASYRLKFGKHFTGALTYTLKSYSSFNIGGGLVFQFLNMQYYLVTDNWYAAVRPLDSKNVNVNFGMNLVFGDRFKGKNFKDHPANDSALINNEGIK